MRQLPLALFLLAQAPGRAGAEAEGLDGVVAGAVRANYEALHGCYRKVLARDRRKEGTLFLRAALGPRDTLQAVSVARDELGSAAATACILGWVRAWTLKGAQAVGVERGAEVVLPLTFRASPEQFAVHREDAEVVELPGGSRARPLLTGSNAGASQASLVLIEVKGRLPLPGKAGVDQVLYLLDGKGKLENLAAARGWDLTAGTAVWIPADARMELFGTCTALQLLVPAGLEREYAAGRPPVTGSQVRRPVVVHPREARAAVRRGPGLIIRPLLDEGRIRHRRLTLGLVEARAGASLPAHRHEGQTEIVFVLEGRGRVTLGEHTVPVEEGHALHFPAGSSHHATMTTALRAVQIFAPAGRSGRTSAGRK